ncbi:hypothetical protein BGI41_05295 [Methanobrevibacter sp. 87.7]|uniref:MJ0144 family RNA dihydrouridine synthase-like protein n=1 Tax=Methanobrevibacter sp. 87.7 TaxID=387957 RepID=UPI000B50F052|nr:MJ0144 family RNA dihydrouridine synthase-like protein [Methanobrevibacter sp. 87.7]OWT32884.1 hypothetical protein BGI41_05295 [Methanobrevibacter sp. 87.7]
MAGICNGDFALKLIPYGFDTVTLGGFNIDKLSIDAGSKIIKRGRKEFNIPYSKIISFIDDEASKVKNNSDAQVSVNLRSVNPDRIIEVSKLESVDIVEINCHCRQEELQRISCGQAMLERPDLKDYIKKVVDNSDAQVSVKIRGNVDDVDTLAISKLIDDAGADYLHVDAMKPGIFDADYDLISKISNNTNIFIIGNNSIDSLDKVHKILNAGADGFSIARAAINGKLNFDLNDI